jgi:hypothetical protein
MVLLVLGVLLEILDLQAQLQIMGLLEILVQLEIQVEQVLEVFLELQDLQVQLEILELEEQLEEQDT